MRSRKGFTLIELLVVIAIIAILAAILFPVFARAKENGKRTFCVGNMKQIYSALTMYADDNYGNMPIQPADYGGSNFAKQQYGFACIYPYIKKSQVFCCPTAREYGTTVADQAKRSKDREPIYTVYRENGQTFKGSYHFWVWIYQLNNSSLPAKLDVNLNDRNLNLWKSWPNVAANCAKMNGPLVDNFLHRLSENEKGVLVMTTKGSIKFMPTEGYPFH